MTKLLILSLITLSIAVYLQARIAARRIRNQRDAEYDLPERRLILLRSDAAFAARRAAAQHRKTQTP